MNKIMEMANTAEVSLSDATKPLLVVSRLFGMNSKTHWHKIYPVFILMSEIFMIYCIWQFYTGIDFKNYYFNVLVGTLHDMSRITSLLIILGSGLFNQERFMVPVKDFVNIDQSFKSLNGFIDNKGTYRYQILLVIYIGLVGILWGLIRFVLIILPITDDQKCRIDIIGWVYVMMEVIVCAVADCSFSSTLSVIRMRFKVINSIIQRARRRGSFLRVNLLEVTRTCTDNDVLRELRILRRQYHDLWRIANRVNADYGLHLLAGVTTSLTLMTSTLWTLYCSFMRFYGSNANIGIESVIWTLVYIVRLFLLVGASVSTVSEAKATYIYLEELGINGEHDGATKTEIRDFLTQIQLEVQKFTACGFFDIDFNLICAIVATACTYLVILIQMNYSNAYLITDNLNESIPSVDKASRA